MGVEPTIGAWEATVLPLHYGREKRTIRRCAPPVQPQILPRFCHKASPFLIFFLYKRRAPRSLSNLPLELQLRYSVVDRVIGALF